MTDLTPRPSGSGIAHKAAAVSLALVAIVVATVAYFLLRPDPAVMRACISAGGSGVTCPSGTLSLAVPALILFGAFSGAWKVWRG